MVHLLIILGVLALIVMTLLLIACLNKSVYNFIFDHKEWNIWENVCKHLNNAVFEERFTDEVTPNLNSYSFTLSLPDGQNLQIIYWDRLGYTSVHTDDECIASSWDRYHSQKASAFLKEKISQLNTDKYIRWN